MFKKRTISHSKAEKGIRPAMANIQIRCNKCEKTGLAIRSGPPFPFFNWLFSKYTCKCGNCDIEYIPPKVVESWDTLKIENLRIILNNINDEITRYRDYEWKLVSLSIAVSWGVFIFAFKETQSLSSVLLGVGAVIVILTACCLLSAHLLFIHGELTTNRCWRKNVESMLGIYEKPTPLPEAFKSIIPGYKIGRDTFLIPFILFMNITAFGLSYVLLQQYEMPPSIFESNNVISFIWLNTFPAIICILLVLELIYIGRAIVVQGLTKRRSY